VVKFKFNYLQKKKFHRFVTRYKKKFLVHVTRYNKKSWVGLVLSGVESVFGFPYLIERGISPTRSRSSGGRLGYDAASIS
jgi:hypothetical protein